ncbi:glucosamine-6-phosphate deaminase [Microbacterium sp. H1-D42]|uniref:6-phosphogluconolactonase n=1 Tax=Microbacterium sp. H1-D42 TaxID=2925844 RepID=UPI001F52D104|nr:glucosamine-6-phosphate deaminase [Microbacterium sp. H1-D42]UNK70701.1 glucosamine-6-phosphate deaminase [Microbacterium sp. H1-D42]
MHNIPMEMPRIHTAASVAEAGREAARRAAAVLREAITSRGTARVIFASAPSQQAMLTALAQEPGIDWTRVHSFHMDEYLGLPDDHPNSFGQWLQQRLPAEALPRLERIRPDVKPAAEAAHYAGLLAEAPIDLVCLGIGMNGHIAFNEPGTSSPDDSETVRVATLDEASRRQQVEEKLFTQLSEVPTHALTLTVPALLSGRSLVCTIIGAHKADAVARAVRGPIDSSLPASFLRTHPDVSWFLDAAAAAALNREPTHPRTSLQL